MAGQMGLVKVYGAAGGHVGRAGLKLDGRGEGPVKIQRGQPLGNIMERCV